MSNQPLDDAGSSELNELIERRATLQKWIDGLDTQRGVAADRVLERVRADYESRLAATTVALSAHLDGVRTELDRATARAADAERVHDDAMDALEEARLRRTIGELPEAGWEETESGLTDAVQRARQEEEAARADADQLREILARLTGEADRESWDKVEVVPAADPDLTVESGSMQPASNPSLVAPSETFLAQIDEALTDDEGEEPLESLAVPDPDGVPGPEMAPPPGLKCGECGYTNDLSAWFCGVCGADVG